MRHERLCLKDIAESIALAESFVAGATYETFAGDPRTVLAVVKALEIAGEAAKSVPLAFRDRYPQVPWNDMARMRDKLTHHYFGWDLPLIWQVLHTRLPGIRMTIEQTLGTLDLE